MSRIILLTVIFTSLFTIDVWSQSDTLTRGKVNLFIKTDVINFCGLNPNLSIELKTSEKISFSFGARKCYNGIIWSAPYLMADSYDRVEWWEMKGYGIETGVRYYYSDLKFFSLSFIYNNLSFKGTVHTSERVTDQRSEWVYRKDFHLRILHGNDRKCYYIWKNSFFYGIGILFSNKDFQYSYYRGIGLAPSVNKGITLDVVPTFVIGYNLRLKVF